jgi:C-terminal processing protease CtpA/Prc
VELGQMPPAGKPAGGPAGGPGLGPLVVMRVDPRGPAGRNGQIMPGDVLVDVDGRDVVGMSLVGRACARAHTHTHTRSG